MSESDISFNLRRSWRGDFVCSKWWLCVFALLAFCIPLSAQEGTFLSTEQFLREAFGGKSYSSSSVSLSSADQASAKKLLGHSYSSRVRYYKSGNRTAWILNKIGKHRPITAGFVVDGGKISKVRVLVYREAYGGEVKNSFFTRQFSGARLSGTRLSRRIGNISGATMSVNSMRAMGRWALYLHGKAS